MHSGDCIYLDSVYITSPDSFFKPLLAYLIEDSLGLYRARHGFGQSGPKLNIASLEALRPGILKGTSG